MSLVKVLAVELLRGVFKSKKAMAAIAAILVIAAQRLGLPIDKETLYEILSVIGTYLISQGIADVGKPAAQLKIDNQEHPISGTEPVRTTSDWD